MIKKYLVVFTLLFITISNAQRETDNWYFGDNSGLKFDYYERPTTLNDSEINAFYGSSSISDKNGNLLFYTNGSFVYNKLHIKMENGELLASDNEVLQSSIIIPKPDDPDIYFLITLKNSNVPPVFGTFIPPGLYYSLVDMSKNNGNGSITKKNLLLNSLVSEKLTAIHTSDGKSIWVMAFGKSSDNSLGYDTLYSYRIDENGINTTPVTSQLSNTRLINKGAMKVSPNGKFLALSNSNVSIFTDFNNETGTISNDNFLRITHGEGIGSIASRPVSHGIEFSQDSKYLYVESIDNGDNIIFQFNTDDIDIRNEINFSNNSRNYMQLAKDGNIYISTSKSEDIGGQYLSLIRPPKNKSINIAGYEENFIDLNLGESRIGLPNFIQSYFRTRITTESVCLNETSILEFDTYADVTSAFWDFGDSNTSSEINPTHVYQNPGFYTISCVLTLNNREIFISKQIEVYTPETFNFTNNNLIQCDTNNDGTDFFNLTEIKENIIDSERIESMKFYLNLSDAEDDLNEINDPTNFENSGKKEIFTRIFNDKGCYVITSFFIESIYVELGNILNYYTCPITESNGIGFFDLGQKRILIRNNLNLGRDVRLRFYANSQNAQTNKDELSDDYSSNSTEIWVRADTPLGCGGIEPFDLVVNNAPITNNINDTYTICYNPIEHTPITLNADLSNDRFEWRNSNGIIINQSENFTLTETGSYSLTVYKTENNIECSFKKDFTVINPDKPEVISLIVNTEDETNNLVDISVSGNSSYEFSLDNINFEGNSTFHNFSNVQAGLRTIYIRDVNNCEPPIETNVSVIGFRKFFSPNGDGTKDFWNVNGLDAEFYKSINIVIFNRYGKIIGAITDFESEGWDGRYNGKLLQPNDYWFIAEIIDIDDNYIKKTGYFSLIQN